MESKSTFRREGNQLIHTRVFNAPRTLVWEIWTDPEHVRHWWGPDGFTLINESMDLRPGGVWTFVLRGMGRDFNNMIIFTEVVKPSLLVYQHSDADDPEGVTFKVYVSFEEMGDQTLLTMRSVFRSEEELLELNRQVNAIEGGKQTLNRLESYINNQLQNT